MRESLWALCIVCLPPCFLAEGKLRADATSEQRLTRSLQRKIHGMQTVSRAAVLLWSHDGSRQAVYKAAGSKTRFPVASVTKPFTALALMRMVEAGHVGLDDRVRRHIPGYPSRATTLRDLLQHTLRTDPQSGAKVFRYGNRNYKDLKRIIEKYSRATLPTYFLKQIIHPAGMRRTRVPRSNGASGIRASGSDLLRFGRIILAGGRTEKGRLLSEASLREMLRPPAYVRGGRRMNYYGLGWRVERVAGKITAVYHTGYWKGDCAELRILPRQRAVIVILGRVKDFKTALRFRSEVRRRFYRMLEARALPRVVSGTERQGTL